MGSEIERKFLLGDAAPQLADAAADEIEQAYVAVEGETELRVRRRGEETTLTLKAGTGIERFELELPIDRDAYESLRALAHERVVTKRRHLVSLGGGLEAEVDVYAGRLEGLAVVEVEFASTAACAAFEPPAWFGREVTGEREYLNRTLATEGRPA